MRSSFKRAFAQYVKKAHKPLQLAIEDAVDVVRAAPDIGETKSGDLAGVQVYKFRFNRQEYLVAYKLPKESAIDENDENSVIEFLQVGPHENFYTELKRALRLVRDEEKPK